MGLFDDFDIDMDEVKAAGGFDFEDGNYDFEISEALIQNGTKNDPDDTKFIIKYDMDEAGTYWEWFTIAVDGNPTAKKAEQSLGFLKSRLVDLGFSPSALNDLDPEDLEGIVGSLQLLTTSGKGKNAANKYQNVRNVKVAVEEEEPEPEPAPKRTRVAKPKVIEVEEAEEEVEYYDPEETDAEVKQRVAAKQAARTAPAKTATVKKAPVKRAAKPAEEEPEDEENPFA